MHCHNDFHAKTGMFMQLIEQPSALRTKLGTFHWTGIPNAICSTLRNPVISWAGEISARYNTQAGITPQSPGGLTPWMPVDQIVRGGNVVSGGNWQCAGYDDGS